MRQGGLIALAGVLAFAAIFLARMPARWIVPTNARFSCTSIEGSLWSGGCSGLTVQGVPLGDAGWDLHPLRLLTGHIAAHVTLAGGALQAQGEIEAGLGGHLTARQLLADLPLDPGLIPGLPAGLTGRAHADLALLGLERSVITQLAGRIEVHDLVDHSGAQTLLGSYAVEFPAAASGEPVGQVRDLDGPLAVQGTLRLTRQPGFELSGLVAPRAQAAPELVNNLNFLGSPDASGRRPFSVSGSF